MIHPGSFVGGERVGGEAGFRAHDRFTGEPLEPEFWSARAEDVNRAAELAHAALRPFVEAGPDARAALLVRIADRLSVAGPGIVERAHRETGLPIARLEGELARTTGQLRFFAGKLAEADWDDPRHVEAMPERQPVPRPAIRSWLRPIGPVAVFGASNFPLAFSTAGGDTASALAAGCPVVVKQHPAHPGTASLVAEAIVEAVADSGLPAGVFSALNDDVDNTIGGQLVRHPRIAAVGFTGSRRVGTLLMRLAQDRPVPIPVYAEMSSVNPVVVTPGALRERAGAIAATLAASVLLGAGQFCTNPGLILVVGDDGRAEFERGLVEAFRASAAQTMLTPGIAASYVQCATALLQGRGVETLLRPAESGQPGLAAVDASGFLADSELAQEVFGPMTLLVRCATMDEAIAALEGLEGQLTASVFHAPDEAAALGDLVWAMERRAGRVIFNQAPTGVEVCEAMVHGGPYPATSHPGFTSVGGRAMLRWLRPVAYQNPPEGWAPFGTIG